MIENFKIDKHLLWLDGSITVEPDDLVEYIYKIKDINRLTVTNITNEIIDYNLLNDTPIKLKSENFIEFIHYNIPEFYKNLDIKKYLLDLKFCINRDVFYNQRIERFDFEFEIFKSKIMSDVLKLVIYIIDTFKQNNIIWGIGRGSSCASYILYLMGLHEVDVIKYDIDISEFLSFVK